MVGKLQYAKNGISYTFRDVQQDVLFGFNILSTSKYICYSIGKRDDLYLFLVSTQNQIWVFVN